MMRMIKSLLSLTVVALLAAPALSKADIADRLYDFTDTYYTQNGINPALISGRIQADGFIGVTDTPNFTYQRDVRALLTLPNYDHSGNIFYFTVLGGFADNAFTAGSAGRAARAIADSRIEYVFPRAGTDPVGLFDLRQSVMLDMRNGYFGKDPLGLWTHVWVSFTSKALNTKAGKKALADMASKNGYDLDGTPIIASTSDIDSLSRKGYITLIQRALTDPLHYSICPVIKDPTDGGIAVDQFLAITLKDDGTPLEPEFLDNFESLRLTGDWQ
jgi:hypothetical protein